MKPDLGVTAMAWTDGTTGFALTCKRCHMDVPIGDAGCMDLSEINKIANAHVCPEPVRRK